MRISEWSSDVCSSDLLVQFVIRCLAEFMPVIKLTREGVQTDWAYALANLTPLSANLCILGVSYTWLFETGESPKGTEVSVHPISSTRNKIMFGLSLLGVLP